MAGWAELGELSREPTKELCLHVCFLYMSICLRESRRERWKTLVRPCGGYTDNVVWALVDYTQYNMFPLELSQLPQAFLLAASTFLQASGYDCLASLPCWQSWNLCYSALGWAIRVCVCVCVCVRAKYIYIHTNAPATLLLSQSTVCHLRLGRCQSGPGAFRSRPIWAWAQIPFGHGPQYTHIYIYMYIYKYVYINIYIYIYMHLSDSYTWAYVWESHRERDRDGKLLWGSVGATLTM